MTVSELARNAGFPGDRAGQACLSRVRFERFQRIAAPSPSRSNCRYGIKYNLYMLYTKPRCTPKRAAAPSVDGEAQAAQARPWAPRGKPSLTAIVSATSARLVRAPIGPAGASAPKARIGTCSRV
jgi:hypothetical protein